MQRKIVQKKPRYNEGPRHWQNLFAITRFRYIEVLFHSRASRTRVGGVPQLSRFTHPRKFGNHETVYRASDRLSARQGNQYLLSHFLASLGAHYGLLCTSISWSHDSGQNMVSTDQYHSTVSRTEVSTHRGRVFFEVIRWQVTFFQMIAGSSLCFKKFIWNMLCLCDYGPSLLRYWFKTDLGRKNSASYLKIQAGKTFFYHGYALVTLYAKFLCSYWTKFDRRVHAFNLCGILKVVYFDSWGWLSFVSICLCF